MALDLDAEDAFVLDLLFDDDPLMYALMTGEESDVEQFFLPQHMRRMEQWRTVEDVVNDDTSSSADNDDPMNGNDNAIPASRGQYPRRPRHERDPYSSFFWKKYVMEADNSSAEDMESIWHETSFKGRQF